MSPNRRVLQRAVDEWTSINELPCWSALYLRVVSEGPFAKLVMPKVWGQAWVAFTTHSSKKARSEEITPVTILITDGVSEEKFGMVTIFVALTRQKGTLQSCFWPSFNGFAWASSGGGEDIHQFPLLPAGFFWAPFPRHSHPDIGCLYYLISTFMATPVPAASVLPHSGHPTQGEGGKWANGHPNHQGGTVGELPWGLPFIVPSITLTATLGPSHICQHLWGEGFMDWWKTQFQCGSDTAASDHSSEVPTWMGAAPWSVSRM